MKRKQIRTVIIAVIIILFAGISLWRLKIEPADTAPKQTEETENPAQEDAAQGGEDAAPEENGDTAEDPAETQDPEKTPEDEKTPAAETPTSGEQPDTKAPYPAAPTEKPQQEKPAEQTKHTCTIEIRCDTVVDTSKLENEAVIPYIPSDGTVLAATEVTYTPGESVFDVLKRATRDHNVQMEFRNDATYSGAYIEGINYLYEFDGGTLSGWMYKVNGQFPNYGCSKYYVSDGDEIVWMYTCDLGRDVGDNSVW